MKFQFHFKAWAISAAIWILAISLISFSHEPDQALFGQIQSPNFFIVPFSGILVLNGFFHFLLHNKLLTFWMSVGYIGLTAAYAFVLMLYNINLSFQLVIGADMLLLISSVLIFLHQILCFINLNKSYNKDRKSMQKKY